MSDSDESPTVKYAADEQSGEVLADRLGDAFGQGVQFGVAGVRKHRFTEGAAVGEGVDEFAYEFRT